MAFLVYQTGFIKSFMVLNPDKCFFIYLTLGTNFKGISYLTTLQLKIAKKKIAGNHF